MKTKTRNKTPLTLFGEVQRKGERVYFLSQKLETPAVFYRHPKGELWQGDSIEWLKNLSDESVDLVFADPPYNIKKAGWDNFESQEEYINFSMAWIEQAARILKPTGTLFVCGFSEILADVKHPASKFFQSCRWIVWHYKNKANLGNDWGRSHESILHFRKTKNFTLNIDNIRIPYNDHTLKYPSHPQAETSQYGKGKKMKPIWEPHPLGAKPKDVLEIPQDMIEIPTTCNGMHEKTPHPTQKPEELLRKLILAASNTGDLVLDPFCGSGTTPVCAQQLQRRWTACDLSQEYLDWAVNRLELVEEWSIETWIQYDLENQRRRNSIR
ncbi:MAG: site-specific DNA-methyltransferase [Planctomycetaceae bacterium]|nr:site-specific DNA-methyltransferase [Planctomycetaceae bacterium]